MTSNSNKVSIPKEIFENIFFQSGGQKKEDIAKSLSGQYQSELPINSPVEANANIEKNEYVKDTEGTRKAVGETHENGGIDVRLQNGARILSDHLKIGGDLARQIKKEYGIDVKASDTYAKVLDKHLKKIGLFKKTDEFEDTVEKLDSQEREIKNEATLALNKEHLMNKMYDIGQDMKPLEAEKDKMFEVLFAAQENSKKKEQTDNFMQDGGVIDLANKYGISQERLAELLPKYQDAGTFYENNQPYFSVIPGNREQYPNYYGLQDWTKEQNYKAEYPLGDISQTAQRFKDLADNAGMSYTDADFKDMKSLNALAGRLQKFVTENKPELAQHYGFNVEPTRQGLQYLVDKGYINPKDYNLPMSGGKVARGSYDTLSTEADRALMAKIQTLPENVRKEYATTNFNDNLAYFRGIKTKEQELSDNEYEAFLSKNKGNEVGAGYFKTDIPGVYVKPTKKGATTTPQPTTPNTEVPTEGTLLPPSAVVEENKRRMGLFLMPDQTPLRPPSILAPSVEAPRVYAHEYMHISPNQQLAEIARTQQGVQKQIDQLPDAQKAATLASLDANNASNLSKVSAEASRYNAQADTQTAAAQAQAMTQQSALNVAANLQNQQLMGRELEGYDADLQNYYNRLNENQLNAFKTINRLNLGNALNRDISFTGDGYEVVNTPEFKAPTTYKKGGTFKKRKKKRF